MKEIVDIITRKQRKELNDLLEVIQTEADIVKQDYAENPSNLDSGSIVVVHQDSSLLENKEEELSDVVYNITRKSSSINDYGDDEWATPDKGDKK
tara:strand:- start:185 stop:469 length:285 start_codon:yes stop_codon:yes gene_type:complete